MKTKYLTLLSVLVLCSSAMVKAQEPLDEMIERGLSVSRNQATMMAKNLKKNKEALPRTFENGKIQTITCNGWISGFFPGVLWQLYGDCGDKKIKEYAELYTDRVEPAKKLTTTHDLGFMLYCSFGQGYRLTGNPHYLEVIKEGSDNLLTRFNPEIGAIKSWESNQKWKYPVIIDNMMNLEMLCFLTKELGDRHYVRVAEKHANTTIANHFRDDYSTWHVVSYDPETHQPHAKQTAQGYSDDSAWARGQAWGLYGFTMMYRETLDKRYLEQARHIAEYICSHPNLPEDGIPYWDFNAPGIPDAQRDVSSGAIIASALLDLCQLDPTADAAKWRNMAEKQLRSLSSPAYLAKPGEQKGFILKHGVGSLPGKSEVDVPLTYADYYYVEALLRMKKLLSRPDGAAEREAWVDALEKIATPVLSNLAAGTLKKNMPFESLSDEKDRNEVCYLEALGRTICGIGPWLELGPDDTPEGIRRAKMIDLAVKAISNAVDPSSPDHLLFTKNFYAQPLVDAAFLAEGILRAPKQLWGNLSDEAKKNLVRELKNSRTIPSYESNWLMFSSIIEAFLLEFDNEYDEERMMHGVERFRNNWYKGDGWYGDGPAMHMDFYNSLVIHPMLTETLEVIAKHGLKNADFLDLQKKRHGRFAEELERMISPEGSYPVNGRSITYRFGSFHALSSASLMHLLPANVNPAQVRCALTAVIERQLSQKNTFDKDGWLRVGYTGAQIHMSESYINTGSEYLCCSVFCALGLPADDPFWSNPSVDWTAKKAWNNLEVIADHSMN